MPSDSQQHIVICSTSYYEYDRRLQRIAKALIAEGYKITWISRQLNPKANPLKDIQHTIIETTSKSGPLFYLEYNIKLYKALRQITPDKKALPIINAIDLDTIPACCLAQKSTQKLIHDAHEIYYEVPELTGKPIKKIIWKLIAKIFLPKIKNNYTVNISLKKHYEQKYDTNYAVIRNVPITVPLLSEIPTAVRTNNKTLLYLGVLNAGRGLEIAIEAMDHLKDYKLILVGDGDISDKLKGMAKGRASIEFRGYVEPQELSKILSTASIGLNMLVADSLNYKLSLANKFFDYMHAGLPSINMAYPEYQAILSEDKVGLMVKEYTSESLIKAVRELEGKSLYDQLSGKALLAAQKYNWDKEKLKLIEAYRSMI